MPLSQTYKARYARRRYVARRKYGMCVHCPSKAIPGKAVCQPCADRAGEYQSERRRSHTQQTLLAFQRRSARWAGRGDCSRCGAPRDRIDRRRCASCRQAEAERQSRTRTAKILRRLTHP